LYTLIKKEKNIKRIKKNSYLYNQKLNLENYKDNLKKLYNIKN